jgi:hypothetical protein
MTQAWNSLVKDYVQELMIEKLLYPSRDATIAFLGTAFSLRHLSNRDYYY